MSQDLIFPKIPKVNILGVDFHKLTADELIDVAMAAVETEQKTVIANVNVHAINYAYELTWYRQFLNEADVVFCDGFGVALGARLTGQSIDAAHRSTCPDWFERLARQCADNRYSLYLLAGKPGVAEQAAHLLTRKTPELRIGFHHGFFEKEGAENDRVIAAINRFEPDILYVGFGMPLQEAWIRDNLERVNAKVFMPLGACLDFYTGAIYRGPRWMTDHGLEWFSRLITEPRRLWRRYILGNSLFLWRVMKERFRMNHSSREMQKRNRHDD